MFRALRRRNALKVILVLLGAAWLVGCARLPFGRPAPPETAVRWALLSDLHVSEKVPDIVRGFDIHGNVDKVVAEIIAAKPDGAIITGDLARNEGLPGDYVVLRKHLEPLMAAMPVAMTLGNHDHRANFLKQFPKHPGEAAPLKGKHVRVIETGGLRFFILDSLMGAGGPGGITAGLLGQEQRQWLARELAKPDPRPVFLFFHHDPGERDGELHDTELLYKIILPSKKVKAIFYGHSHDYVIDKKDGLYLINIPAVAYNFDDKTREPMPVGWIEAKLSARGGEFTLHAVGGNTRDNGKTVSLVWR